MSYLLESTTSRLEHGPKLRLDRPFASNPRLGRPGHGSDPQRAGIVGAELVLVGDAQLQRQHRVQGISQVEPQPVLNGQQRKVELMVEVSAVRVIEPKR